MIQSVARASSRSFVSVAAEPYALTLYTHLHNKDIQYQESLTREDESIAHAEMIATAFHDPKKLENFRHSWRGRAFPIPVVSTTREELARHADEIYAQHESAMKRRPVS